MKKLITPLLLAALSLNSWGDTNCPSAPRRLFSLPPVHLQTHFEESEKAAPKHSNVLLALDRPEPESAGAMIAFDTESVSNSIPERAALNVEEARMLRYFAVIEGGGYLSLPPQPSANLYTRTVNAIFQPEAIRVGATFVSFSPLTAIKRKNPLALLNPIVLNIAW